MHRYSKGRAKKWSEDEPKDELNKEFQQWGRKKYAFPIQANMMEGFELDRNPNRLESIISKESRG